jgi:hypothetical protein
MPAGMPTELVLDATALAVWLLWAYLANGMALRRNRSTKLWVLLAVLAGPFALIVLKFLPPRVAHA